MVYEYSYLAAFFGQTRIRGLNVKKYSRVAGRCSGCYARVAVSGEFFRPYAGERRGPSHLRRNRADRAGTRKSIIGRQRATSSSGSRTTPLMASAAATESATENSAWRRPSVFIMTAKVDRQGT